MKILLLLFFLIVFIIGIFLFRKRFFISPVPLFLIIQFVFFIGTLGLVDLDNNIDFLHIFIIIISQVFFIFGALLIEVIFKPKISKFIIIIDKSFFNLVFSDKLIIFLIIIVSIPLGFLYYYLVGYNLFLVSIQTFLATGTTVNDMASLRLAAYSGENYYAPGYINQFKNTLLPLVIITLFFYNSYFKDNKIRIINFILIPISIILLLGTGQRGAFITICIVVFFVINNIYTSRKKIRANQTIVTFVLIFFFISTLLLGRSTQTITSLTDVYLIAIGLFERVFSDNQFSSVVGFRYVTTLQTQWGMEWIKDLLGLLPGLKGSTLSNEIFSILYGSMRGTSPLSIWGSAWYNFHVFGVTVFPFLLGASFHLIPVVFQSFFSKKINLFDVVILSGIIVILGTWGAGTITTPINQGLLSVFLLMILRKIIFQLFKR